MSNRYRKNLLVCNGSSCQLASDFDLVAFINFKLNEYHLENEIKVVHSVCSSRCTIGPNIIVYPDNVEYSKVTKADIDDIIIEHLLNDRIVERLVFNKENGIGVTSKIQYRIALRNCGFIDPEEIKDYIEKDGYDALAKCLTENTPQEVTQEIIKSGLRGRGGGGFPTGLKWDITSKSVADQKYVVCNADEGDPGAFMDRSVLEGDPHSVIEAMAICGYCIGATKGIIYVRAEYPLAIKRLKIALDQAKEYGLLGTNIFGTNFEFTIDIKYGAGAFVCGEETALIHSMEGLRGEPTLKPPFPSVSGYLKKPTNVNNVETFANIPAIINKGADWFASIGTEKSKGTKVFALAGKINNVGLIEVPMGTTLREVIYDIGGGIVDEKKFKAVQTGGPSGGCLTEKHLDLPIDFDSLTAAGSMMGSGGMIVMDEDDCMVSMARFYLEFIVEESCGKCAPCRIGNKRLHEMLSKLCDGNGTMQDLDLLRNLSVVVKDTSLCGLGQTSPNPIISTMTNFYDEYYAHVAEHRCPSGQCKSFMRYYISEENCIGCLVCARKCPVGAITGEKKKVHFINQELCTKCGICMEKCKFHAVYLN
ncbi:NADH-ubiquinone oxidoreductase-F iron-sulfur binding region domain-containing protein [Flavobacterium sp.]|uniref:NADH-ubiquinone oxidoreductase-F iron-sulfur binding region domain-containing protein n=1 Tax=Flavobacterium sp. TaxID=239 RepID=UPI0037528EFA